MQFARSPSDAGRNRTSFLVLTKRESPYPFLHEQRSPSHCALLCRNVTDSMVEICHFLTWSSTNLPRSIIATGCFPLARHSSLSLRFLIALAAQSRSTTLQLQQFTWKIWSYSALEDASVNFFCAMSKNESNPIWIVYFRHWKGFPWEFALLKIGKNESCG